MNSETITNWIVVTGAIVLGIAIIIGWLSNIHAQHVTRAVSSGWFAMPVWAQVILGFAAIAFFICVGFLLWIPLPLRLPELMQSLARPIGLGLFLTGLSIALWARWILGAMYGVSTGSSAPLQDKHRLVQHGPYAFIRHPMYLGYWLVILGVLLMYRTWTPLLLLAMTVPSFYRRARREEISLGELFGEEWQAYVKNVPMFLPQRIKRSKEPSH